MEWGDVAAWAALALSGGALWVSIKARGDGRRSADIAAAALALQREEATDRREAEQEAARPRVDLRIQHARGTRYRVTNHGTATAADVRCAEPPENSRGLEGAFSLEPGGGYDFNVLAADGVPVPTSLMVTWDGQDEPVRLPMPPA